MLVANMKKKVTFGISFPDPDLLSKAKSRADEIGLSLSSYVNQLLRQDLGMPNALRLCPVPPKPLEATSDPLARYETKAAPRRSRSAKSSRIGESHI